MKSLYASFSMLLGATFCSPSPYVKPAPTSELYDDIRIYVFNNDDATLKSVLDEKFGLGTTTYKEEFSQKIRSGEQKEIWDVFCYGHADELFNVCCSHRKGGIVDLACDNGISKEEFLNCLVEEAKETVNNRDQKCSNDQ